MMPARAWLPILLITFFIGVIVESRLLLALAMSVGLIVTVSYWWQRHSLDGVVYRRRWHYLRCFPGEEDQVRIEVENRKALPVSWLRASDDWPKTVGPSDETVLAPSHIPAQGYLVNLFSLRWFERASRTYTLRFRQRGIYQVGPASLESGDLFGLYNQTREVAGPEYLTVFPELIPLENLKLDTEDPFGDRRTRRRLLEDPNLPMGTRDYHPDDEFRRIHWPATVRSGRLQAKLYQPVSAQTMVICLNISTRERYWEGINPPLLEQLVKVAATLCYHGIQDGYSVGLISNGCLVHADQPFRLAPGRSPHQLSRLLGLLAGVSPFTVGPFDQYLLRSMTDLPFGATVVIVTGIMTSSLSATLLRLKRYRRHMTLVTLSKDIPEELPGITTLHLPFQEGPS
jgi:uncharacterized protein (DUF58 family)